jgi:hypothetical protein
MLAGVVPIVLAQTGKPQKPQEWATLLAAKDEECDKVVAKLPKDLPTIGFSNHQFQIIQVQRSEYVRAMEVILDDRELRRIFRTYLDRLDRWEDPTIKHGIIRHPYPLTLGRAEEENGQDRCRSEPPILLAADPGQDGNCD